MRRLAISAIRHPRAWLIGTGLLTAVVALGLFRLELRTDGAALYPDDDPVVAQTRADRDKFQDDEHIVVLVSSVERGPSLQSPTALQRLRDLHESLQNLSVIRSASVVSLASLPDVRGTGEAISVTGFLDQIPDDSIQFDDFLGRLDQHAVARGLYLSPDGGHAALYAPLDYEDRKHAVRELEQWRASLPQDVYSVRLAGPIMAESALGDVVIADLRRMIPLVIAAIAFLLLISVRSWGGVVLPLVEAGLSVIWALGLMGWLGVPITLVTTVLPALVMTIAISDEIHLLERLQSRLSESSADSHRQPRQLMRDALGSAYRDVGEPIQWVSLTTAIGFFSFSLSPIVPLRQFGIFAGCGILAAMVLSFTLIPALAMVVPPAWFRTPALLYKASRATRPEVGSPFRPRAAFVIGLVIVSLLLPGLAFLKVQDAWYDNLDPESPLAVAERDFNDAFWGGYRFDLVLQAEPGHFHRPEGLAILREAVSAANRAPQVAGVLSHLAPLDEIASALDEKLSHQWSSPEMIAQSQLLIDATAPPPGVRPFITEDGDAVRLRLIVNSPDYQRAADLKDHLDSALTPVIAGSGARIHYSGDLPLAISLIEAIVGNQLRSLAVALAGIAVLFILIYPRGLRSLLLILPVVAATLSLCGMMGYLGISLGIATSLFAGLMIGIGVDFALYVHYEYSRCRRKELDDRAAWNASMATAGRAVKWDAVVLGLGFLLLTASAIRPNFYLGLLMGLGMALSYLCTRFFLPAILRWVVIPAVIISGLLFETVVAQTAPDAQSIMAEIERGFRATQRVVRMTFSTTSPKSDQPVNRVIWGVINGDPIQSAFLYVVTSPKVFEGTTLLFRDWADPARPDTTWLYLPAFRSFRALETGSFRQMIPGTALSYEDSRGFLSGDKYRFEWTDSSTVGAHQNAVNVLALPRTSVLQRSLGCRALYVTADTGRGMITSIEYRDLFNRPVKNYELISVSRVGDAWMPQTIRVLDRLHDLDTRVTYDYWMLSVPPAPDVFTPSLDGGAFLERLQKLVKPIGIDVLAPSASPGQIGK